MTEPAVAPAMKEDRLVTGEDERKASLSANKRALLERLEVGGVDRAAVLGPSGVLDRSGTSGRAGSEVLVPLKTGGSGTALYCVHPASGSAYTYGQLGRSLAGAQAVYGIEAPGFGDDGRRPIASVEGLSAEYVEAVCRHRPAGTSCLLGWSMGGAVAFDMARRLRALGSPVPVLIVVDAPAPEVGELPPDRDLLRHFLCDLLGIADRTVPVLDPVLAGWREPDGSTALFQEIEQAGVLPPDLNARSLQRRFAVYRANMEAMSGYRPRYVHSGPITLIRASGSPPEYMRWDRLASDVHEYSVPGDHYSMWTGHGLARLSEIVQRCLDGAARLHDVEGRVTST